MISSIHDSLQTTGAVKAAWMQRITEIEETILNALPVGLRTRRGLLNFVGILSNKLFGTATESQVAECRRLLVTVSASNQRITHVFKELTSVVNQTHDQVKENREHLVHIENYITQVSTTVNKISSQLRKQAQQVRAMIGQLYIGQVVASIESVHNSWLRRLDKYQRQRASLDLGWLTEEILPKIELDRIIVAGKQRGMQALPIRWYYEHVKIQPMWEDETKLVFKAELPFSDNMDYLRYHLVSWPIPRGANQTWIKLKVPADVAFHTETGGLFEPNSCLGTRPAICHTGPVYDRTRFRCARGVLTSESNLQGECKVTMTGERPTSNLVTELSPGTFVIVTSGALFSLLCSGQSEKRINLSAGAYLLPLSSSCSLRGDGWTISGLLSRSSDIIVKVPIIHIPPLNLSSWIPDESIVAHLNSPTWAALKKVEDISLSSLKDLDMDNVIGMIPESHQWLNTSSSTWIIMIIVVCIVFLCVVMKSKIVKISTICRQSRKGVPPAGSTREEIPLRESQSNSSDHPDQSSTMPSAWLNIIRRGRKTNTNKSVKV